jgi:Golgi nucleoside diphosphatase
MQELQKNFDLALKKYQVESDTIGISEQQKSIAEAISKIEIDAAAAKKKLQDDFSALNKEDQARQQAFYQEQLNSIDEIAAKQKLQKSPA